MRRLVLLRLDQTAAATFGRIEDEQGRQLCVTLELPWKDNAPDVSCVPAGVYVAHRRFSPKHRCEVFELAGVPHRENIELHVGNTVADSLGCILLGSAFADFDGEHGIERSRVAFEAFMQTLAAEQTFTLAISDPAPAAAVPAVPASSRPL